MNKKVAILGKQNPIAVRKMVRDFIHQYGFIAALMDMDTRNILDFYDKLWDYDVVITCGEKIPTDAVIGQSKPYSIFASALEILPNPISPIVFPSSCLPFFPSKKRLQSPLLTSASACKKPRWRLIIMATTHSATAVDNVPAALQIAIPRLVASS